MSPSGLEYLQHILREAEYLIHCAEGMGKDEFMGDETLKRAFVRSLEVIGEAAKHLPADLRQTYGQVEWRAIAGMRDRLIHEYFGVDYDIVWDVVLNKIPPLWQDVKQIIHQQGGER
jgi:uncharacterized protein with HEPN domain